MNKDGAACTIWKISSLCWNLCSCDIANNTNPYKKRFIQPQTNWLKKLLFTIDYYEGAFECKIGSNLEKAATKIHKENVDLYREAKSYAKSRITNAVYIREDYGLNRILKGRELQI